MKVPRHSDRLQGKVALVTGIGSGIGQACALMLARHGAQVAGCDINEGSYALAHCAGKGGVLAMTRQLAMEGAPRGIRANSISPGHVETGATRSFLEMPGMREAVTSKHMLKRLGRPEDIAWCVTFLASDESSWITAADIAVDGGVTKC